MEKLLFNSKYRIPSSRLRSWDYASEGMYFVTICTKNREHYFGDITESDDGSIILLPTEIGKIASSEWYKTLEMRPDMNLELGEFVVMPNHIHGIIIIGANDFNRTDGMHSVSNDTDTDAKHCVSTAAAANKFAPQSKNLASIIRGYKSAVTTFARKNNIDFDWQTRYHDHIIRSADAYNKISHYILNNPNKWHQDKFFGLR